MKIKKLIFIVILIILIAISLYIIVIKLSKYNVIKENKDEYEKYKGYYEKYKDDFALLFIKNMVDEGKITPEMLDSINGTLYTGTDEATWEMYREIYEEWSSILNGKQEEMYPEALDAVNNQLYEEAAQGIIHITLFDTEEKRQRVMNGIEKISEFYVNPTEGNREKMEDMYFSDDLTPGEIDMLFTWILANPNVDNVKTVTINGKEYTMGDYLTIDIERYGTSMGKRDYEAYESLIELNNTPNSEKDQTNNFIETNNLVYKNSD